ncbi:MAG: SufE family protein [Prevotella sp.]|nr:SufE family protein [Prevotella sp.]
MTINEIQNEIIEEFADFDDWMDKYQMLIEAGNALPPLSDKHKTENNLIDGCQSRVWLVCEYSDGVMTLLADSDALIVKGIIALLLRIFNRQTPADILAADLYSIREIGLQDHLSPTRANGLLAMIKQIRTYAAVYSKK